MTDELRQALIGGLTRLGDDVVVGRHGDPHVAVTVLVYPDREPTILVVYGGGSPKDLTRIRRVDPESKAASGSGPIPFLEIREAADALREATFAVRYLGNHDPGEAVRKAVQENWQRHRMYAVNRALEAAAYEASRPAICPHCKRRFTTRGLPMHLARSRYCSRKENAS